MRKRAAAPPRFWNFATRAAMQCRPSPVRLQTGILIFTATFGSIAVWRPNPAQIMMDRPRFHTYR